MPQIRPLLADPSLKLVFLCSPNNPTGNLLRRDDIEEILRAFQGLVVVDEAYIPYAEADSWVRRLDACRNLVVVQTLSKSQALAGARVGIGFGDPEVLAWLRRIKPPYNLGDPAQKAALAALSDADGHDQRVRATLQERGWLERHLPDLPCVRHVFSSDANFLLVEVDEPRRLYEQLAQAGIIVRDRSHEVPGCLRITVGTTSENRRLLDAMWRLCEAQDPQPPSPADPIIIP
jgi:histidinol-phosphate aminotransferase